MEADNILVLMEKLPDSRIMTHVATNGMGYEAFSLLVCDLVRHIALAYEVDEDDIWEWVDKERYHHTTPIETLRPV